MGSYFSCYRWFLVISSRLTSLSGKLIVSLTKPKTFNLGNGMTCIILSMLICCNLVDHGLLKVLCHLGLERQTWKPQTVAVAILLKLDPSDLDLCTLPSFWRNIAHFLHVWFITGTVGYHNSFGHATDLVWLFS